MRSGAAEAAEFATIFVLKVINCKLQEKIGERDILVAPPIILLGGAVAPPGSWAYGGKGEKYGNITLAAAGLELLVIQSPCGLVAALMLVSQRFFSL